MFMRLRPVMAGAICALAAGIAMTGCSSASSSTAAGINEVNPTTGAAATTGTPATTPSAGSTQPGGAATAGGGAANCQPGGLRIALGTRTGAAGQQATQVVDMTNTGTSACVMDGFPGTNLVGTAVGPRNYSKQGYTWSLERASRSYSTVPLQPGATAHFDLIYLPSSSSDIASGSEDLKVTSLVITPPNDFTHAQVSWPQGVLLQDGATHPGTYVTPVVSGA
jgi:hypothetical protein